MKFRVEVHRVVRDAQTVVLEIEAETPMAARAAAIDKEALTEDGFWDDAKTEVLDNGESWTGNVTPL